MSSVLVARYLGVIEYGKFALFIQASGYAAVLIEIGLPSAIIFSVRKKHNLNTFACCSNASCGVRFAARLVFVSGYRIFLIRF